MKLFILDNLILFISKIWFYDLRKYNYNFGFIIPSDKSPLYLYKSFIIINLSNKKKNKFS